MDNPRTKPLGTNLLLNNIPRVFCVKYDFIADSGAGSSSSSHAFRSWMWAPERLPGGRSWPANVARIPVRRITIASSGTVSNRIRFLFNFCVVAFVNLPMRAIWWYLILNIFSPNFHIYLLSYNNTIFFYIK